MVIGVKQRDFQQGIKNKCCANLVTNGRLTTFKRAHSGVEFELLENKPASSSRNIPEENRSRGDCCPTVQKKLLKSSCNSDSVLRPKVVGQNW